jgi:phosphate transport system substrate-binding protein
LSKKRIALISLLIIVSVAIVTVAVTYLLTPLFQPRSDLLPEHEEAERTQIVTNDSSSNQTAASPTTLPTTIDIVSTTSAFPFVQRWSAQYENQQPASSDSVNVDYLADSEIIAAEEGSGRSDLAIVGVPNENNNTLYVPVSAQAVAIVYNIPSFPDIPSGLRLNSTILSLLLNGSITQWDDEAIKDLNPNLNLPDERIVVVHSSDDDNNTNSSSSSSLMLLNQFLGHTSLSWPKNDSLAASGPAELAEMVRKIPYSLGYVDFSYAVQTRMTYAAIGNADGDYVVPSMKSIGRAVDVGLQFHNYSIDRSSSQQLRPPTINSSRIVSDSYPIVGLYYASLLANDDDNDDNEQEGRRRIVAMLDFVKWIISESGGQQALLEVQYPPIYPGNEQLATYAKIITDAIQKSLSN